MASSSVKKEDRLFSLILALSVSRDGLTKSEILKSVRGYSERFTFDSDPTLDKLFERDKKELRSMGVVIDTFEFAGEEGETHNIRYAINRANYALPEDVTFSPAEVALLNVAAQAWREASLSADSRHALNKIRSLGVAADDSLLGIAPRIRTVDRSFPAFADALENESILTFLYLKPGEISARERRCAPLALVSWKARWYALAYDFDAQAERTFLLSRVVSVPARVPQQTWTRESEDYSARLLRELETLAKAQSATFNVSASSTAFRELLSWGAEVVSPNTLRLDYADAELLADDLIALLDAVEITQPSSLVKLVSERVDRIATLHAGGSL